jgi:hypothetical protein
MNRTIKICKEEKCNDMQTTGEYCRLHYIKNWKKLKENQCLKEGITYEEFVKRIILKKPKILDIANNEDKKEKGSKRIIDVSGLDEVVLNSFSFDEEIDDILKDITALKY